MESLKFRLNLKNISFLFILVILITATLFNNIPLLQIWAQQTDDLFSDELAKEDYAVIYVLYDSDFELFDFPGNGSESNPLHNRKL